jgi:hypothetical protein
MSRTVALDPVCSGGATKVTAPPVAKTTTVALDPRAAILDGTQTAVTEVA